VLVLAHHGNLLEDSLYLAPIALLVALIVVGKWRERREGRARGLRGEGMEGFSGGSRGEANECGEAKELTFNVEADETVCVSTSDRSVQEGCVSNGDTVE
jgi:hypothetical protein